MSKKKAPNKRDIEHDKVVKNFRAISSGIRQALSSSLCPQEQAEYERRLAEDANASNDPV